MRQERIRLIGLFLAIFVLLCLAWFGYQGRLSLGVASLGVFFVFFSLAYSYYIPQFLSIVSKLKEGKDIYKEKIFYDIIFYLILISSYTSFLCLILFADKIIINFGETVLALLMLASVITPLFAILIFVIVKNLTIKSK